MAIQHIRSAIYFPKIAELLQPAESILRAEQEARRKQLLLERQEQEAQRYFSREEAAKLLTDLYAKLKVQKEEEEKQVVTKAKEYSDRQKAVAQRLIADGRGADNE